MIVRMKEKPSPWPVVEQAPNSSAQAPLPARGESPTRPTLLYVTPPVDVQAALYGIEFLLWTILYGSSSDESTPGVVVVLNHRHASVRVITLSTYRAVASSSRVGWLSSITVDHVHGLSSDWTPWLARNNTSGPMIQKIYKVKYQIWFRAGMFLKSLITSFLIKFYL